MKNNMTTLDELKQQITTLASVEESGTPFFSVYLNMENDDEGWYQILDERAQVLRRVLQRDELYDFEEVMIKIKAWLSTELHPETKGVAIFARGSIGGEFMQTMQFAAPLPDWIAVYPTPNIYHLVELKDNYHRYIVLLTLPERTSVFEVNLGAATIQAWMHHTQLPGRVGSEWSRPHYQVHQKNRGDQFINEKIALLERLMCAGGQTHLIISGDPDITGRIRHALPDNLVSKLVDVIPASEMDQQHDVVSATLSVFIEHEEDESQTVVDCLIDGLRSHNLAVAGSTQTLDALRWGEVDTLVMAKDFEPDPGWVCTDCKSIGTVLPETTECPECGRHSVRSVDIKETFLRFASQMQRQVEIVEQSDALMSLGGVGCLLRYKSDLDDSYHFDKKSDDIYKMQQHVCNL